MRCATGPKTGSRQSSAESWNEFTQPTAVKHTHPYFSTPQKGAGPVSLKARGLREAKVSLRAMRNARHFLQHRHLAMSDPLYKNYRLRRSLLLDNPHLTIRDSITVTLSYQPIFITIWLDRPDHIGHMMSCKHKYHIVWLNSPRCHANISHL